MAESDKILEVKDLRISFNVDSGTVKAVRGISFDLYRGKTLCIVGESGSGKSVTSRAILGILAKNAIVEGGEIIYDGKDLLTINEDRFHKIRGSKISMIFQDPLSALNPIMRVGKQLTEPIFLKAKANRREARSIYRELASATSREAKKFGVSIDTVLLKRFRSDVIAALQAEEAQKKYDRECAIRLRNEEIVLNADKYPAKTIKAAKRYLSLHRSAPKPPETDEEDFVIPGEVIAIYASLIGPSHKEYALRLGQLKNLVNEILAKALATEVGDYDVLRSYLGSVKKAIPFFAFRDDEDDRVAVFATSYGKYVALLRNALRHQKKEEAKKAKYAAKGEEVPPLSLKQRAKLPERFLTPEEASAMLKELCLNLVAHIDEELSRNFDSDEYASEFASYLVKTIRSVRKKVKRQEAKEQALEIMGQVGIPQPEIRFRQYPFEFSGGMRQRIVIAIALSSRPEILICDEPTTALDVTIQAQILELINKLKEELDLSIIFITHDLGVVANMADDIAVMYAGKIVEYGTVDDIFYDPRHPYTWALLSSMPDLDTKQKIDAIPGTPPNMVLPPLGDAFAARNKYALAIDYEEEPPLFKVSDTHFAATWLLREDAPQAVPPTIVTERIKRALDKRAKKGKGGE